MSSRCLFTKHLIYKHFLKPLLLDFLRGPMGQKPDGQLNFSGFFLSVITLNSMAGGHKNFRQTA